MYVLQLRFLQKGKILFDVSLFSFEGTCCSRHPRTIIHIDVDCFYAQVEMLRNPALRDKPLGSYFTVKKKMYNVKFPSSSFSLFYCSNVKTSNRWWHHYLRIEVRFICLHLEMKGHRSHVNLADVLKFPSHFSDVQQVLSDQTMKCTVIS